MRELSWHDGVNAVILNIVQISSEDIVIAITETGKHIIKTFELKSDEKNNLYFEYGIMLDKIFIEDFEKMED